VSLQVFQQVFDPTMDAQSLQVIAVGMVIW
jgi:hypothetical protein